MRHRLLRLYAAVLQKRAGHCEYFATAAVLLLRAAGIPARYATGFSVSEYSPLEGSYVARRRHAHAWALAWLEGRWRDFDATPPDWTSFEEERAPWYQNLGDLWDWLSHQFSRWRWRETTGEDGDNRWLWGPSTRTMTRWPLATWALRISSANAALIRVSRISRSSAAWRVRYH